MISLGDPDLHPAQLAYDARRDGLWFWTSTQQNGATFDNRVYFYDITSKQLRQWPIYSGDWSSQLHSGIAVAPDGDVWIGWNHNIVDFHPSDGSSQRIMLPATTQYPLPAQVIGDLPADLGVADLAVAPDGTLWIARYGALSLTAFTRQSGMFKEYPLPLTAGDPAKLVLGPNGKVFFTVDLSANHPGYGGEKVGVFDPRTGATTLYAHPAMSLTVTPNGDMYTALAGHSFGADRLTAGEQSAASNQGRAAVFQSRVVPFDVDDAAIASDSNGRIWMAVGGQPQVAVLDPRSGSVNTFQYAAPSVAMHPASNIPPGVSATTMNPNAVWLVHIVAMVTDKRGHLWYIRAGSGNIEEVSA